MDVVGRLQVCGAAQPVSLQPADTGRFLGEHLAEDRLSGNSASLEHTSDALGGDRRPAAFGDPPFSGSGAAPRGAGTQRGLSDAPSGAHPVIEVEQHPPGAPASFTGVAKHLGEPARFATPGPRRLQQHGIVLVCAGSGIRRDGFHVAVRFGELAAGGGRLRVCAAVRGAGQPPAANDAAVLIGDREREGAHWAFVRRDVELLGPAGPYDLDALRAGDPGQGQRDPEWSLRREEDLAGQAPHHLDPPVLGLAEIRQGNQVYPQVKDRCRSRDGEDVLGREALEGDDVGPVKVDEPARLRGRQSPQGLQLGVFDVASFHSDAAGAIWSGES